MELDVGIDKGRSPRAIARFLLHARENARQIGEVFLGASLRRQPGDIDFDLLPRFDQIDRALLTKQQTPLHDLWQQRRVRSLEIGPIPVTDLDETDKVRAAIASRTAERPTPNASASCRSDGMRPPGSTPPDNR